VPTSPLPRREPRRGGAEQDVPLPGATADAATTMHARLANRGGGSAVRVRYLAAAVKSPLILRVLVGSAAGTGPRLRPHASGGTDRA